MLRAVAKVGFADIGVEVHDALRNGLVNRNAAKRRLVRASRHDGHAGE